MKYVDKIIIAQGNVGIEFEELVNTNIQSGWYPRYETFVLSGLSCCMIMSRKVLQKEEVKK